MVDAVVGLPVTGVGPAVPPAAGEEERNALRRAVMVVRAGSPHPTDSEVADRLHALGVRAPYDLLNDPAASPAAPGPVAPPPAPSDLREQVALAIACEHNPHSTRGNQHDHRLADAVLAVTQAAQAAAVAALEVERQRLDFELQDARREAADAREEGRREGFHAGVNASAEGWNGEYPPAPDDEINDECDRWLRRLAAGDAT